MCILVASLGSAVQLPLIWFSVSVLGGLVQPLAVQVRVCFVLSLSSTFQSLQVCVCLFLNVTHTLMDSSFVFAGTVKVSVPLFTFSMRPSVQPHSSE